MRSENGIKLKAIFILSFDSMYIDDLGLNERVFREMDFLSVSNKT